MGNVNLYRVNNILFILISILSFCFLFFSNVISLYESIAISIFVYFLLTFISDIGEKFNIIDIAIPLAFLIWLVVPVITYNLFNERNGLARLWDTYMKLPSDEYFSFTLPATFLFAIGLKFPFREPYKNHYTHIINLKKSMIGKSRVSVIFLLIGLAATLILPSTPESIRNIVFNFSYLSFVGMFYAIYSNFKQKSIIIIICVLLLLTQVIASGMYGPLIYLSIITFLILSVSSGVSLRFKTIGILLGIFGIFFIQAIKGEYREATWEGLERNGDPVIFGSIVIEKLSNPLEIFDPSRLFAMTVRTNQGALVADAINYVPRYEPFAKGETIILAVLSSFVPRFLWPSKPRAGGADNVCRFLGDCYSAKVGVAYNLGPIGEAYVNFGRNGGIIFMFFYGLFMKYCFVKVLRISVFEPTLILWLPLLFICVFSMENDVLGFINSLFKSAFFCFICYKGFYMFFRLKI